MRIELDRGAGTVEAVFMQPVGGVFRPGDRLPGRFRIERGLLACGVAIGAR